MSVWFSNSTVPAMIALTIGTMGVMTTISQFWVLPPAFLGGAAAAAGLAFANSVGSISGVVSPSLIGVVKTATGSAGAGVLALSVSLLIAGLLVLFVPPTLVNPRR
jgi:hypothetical protein